MTDQAMSAFVQRFIRDDLSPEQGWRLIDWCIERMKLPPNPPKLGQRAPVTIHASRRPAVAEIGSLAALRAP